MRAWGVVLLVLLAAGCGGGSKQSVPEQPSACYGWDLLYLAPYKARVNTLVFDFLRERSQ